MNSDHERLYVPRFSVGICVETLSIASRIFSFDSQWLRVVLNMALSLRYPLNCCTVSGIVCGSLQTNFLLERLTEELFLPDIQFYAKTCAVRRIMMPEWGWRWFLIAWP